MLWMIKRGNIDVVVDRIIPHLERTEGITKHPVSFLRMANRMDLLVFSEKNGWRINWAELPDDIEVYAVALADAKKIQGMIGLKNDPESAAAHICCACVSPQNNRHDFGKCDYIGVGALLFAFAARKSIEWGYGGAFYGSAATRKMLRHYEKTLCAEHKGPAHQYGFFVHSGSAHKLLSACAPSRD